MSAERLLSLAVTSFGLHFAVFLVTTVGLLMLAVRPSQPTRGGWESMNAVFFLFMIVTHLVLAGLRPVRPKAFVSHYGRGPCRSKERNESWAMRRAP